MSTSNFMPMKYGMPLICGGLGSFDEYKKVYEENLGEEYSEDMYRDDLNYEFDDAANLADAFSDTLSFHKVSVMGGYYQGFQFYVDETCTCGDLEKTSPYCIDNDDARYCYDMTRSEVLRRAASEKKKIKKWLADVGKVYDVLECLGHFSNGEALYRIVTT